MDEKLFVHGGLGLIEKKVIKRRSLSMKFSSFFFSFCSTRHEGKTLPRNLVVLLKNGEEVS